MNGLSRHVRSLVSHWFIPSHRLSHLTAYPMSTDASVLHLGEHPMTGEDRLVSYVKVPASSDTAGVPGLIYVPGFMSHKSGTKAMNLEKYAVARGCGFVRYDPESLGESSGLAEHASFEHWVEDMEAVLDQLTEGPQILVGSSMGAWISMLVAPRKADRIHSLVFISPVLNFIYPYFRIMYNTLDEEAKSIVDSGEVYMADTIYGPIPLRKPLAEASRQWHLDKNGSVAVDCPVRILHGMKDERCTIDDVMRIVEMLNSPDVEVLSRKAGEHRLCDPEDNENLVRVLDGLIFGDDLYVPSARQ